MRRFLCLLVIVFLLLSATGCGSMFSDEYYYSEPYREAASIGDGTETEVRNSATLKSAILELIYAGESQGQFRFGSYTGSLVDDLAAICLEIKTSTPIGAYAVEDISYDTSRIVSYYTADINIEYKRSAEEIAAVRTINGLAELGSHILSVMDSYGSGTVVKIYSSAAGEDYIRELVSGSYYADPFLMAMEPELSVTAYPESGPDRIYVIDFRYGAMPERLEEMDALLAERCAVLAESLGQDDPLSLALRCAMSLAGMCANAEGESQWAGTAYGCIVEGSGDSLGLAMGYKALCDCLGIDCVVVRGERNDGGVAGHAWNIIGFEGDYYHVDVSRILTEPSEAFLLSDEDLWGEYDWEREAYPVCDGVLRPEDFFDLPIEGGDVPVEESPSPELPGESPDVEENPPEEPAPEEPQPTEPVE